MSSATLYPHLTTTDDGSVRIGNTRYKVEHLAAEHYHHGWSAEELRRNRSGHRCGFPESNYCSAELPDRVRRPL